MVIICTMLSISLFVMILYTLSKSTENVELTKENKELKTKLYNNDLALIAAGKMIDRLKHPSSY